MTIKMKALVAAFYLLTFLAPNASAQQMSNFTVGSAAPEVQLKTLRGDNIAVAPFFGEERVILIFVPAECGNEADGYLAQLSKHKADLEDRDLRIFVIAHESAVVHKKDYGENIVIASKCDTTCSRASASAIPAPLLILIGKDKMIKLREPKFVSDKALFALIDTMPMRIEEVKKKKNSVRHD